MHRPIPLTENDRNEYGCDVMLAGNLYYYRQELLGQISGANVKVWGYRPDWLIDSMPGCYMGRPVYGDDKVKAALGATICLNTLHYAEVDGLNCRAFELAGCGGFQLISRTAALKEHFEIDKEVVAYDSADELAEKVHYFLRNATLAAEIAKRGNKRAHRDHTYEHRLQELLRISLS
jgi:spore maturation protein CgeB